jgi:hypothetical protein
VQTSARVVSPMKDLSWYPLHFDHRSAIGRNMQRSYYQDLGLLQETRRFKLHKMEAWSLITPGLVFARTSRPP